MPEPKRDPTELSPDQQADAAAGELKRVYEEAYGKPVGTISAGFINDHALVCLLEDLEFQPNEQYLIEAGMSDQLVQTRMMFQKAIEPTFIAAVEHSTGRRVRNFNSVANVDPPMDIEIFVFEP